jgi:hypothetical protein
MILYVATISWEQLHFALTLTVVDHFLTTPIAIRTCLKFVRRRCSPAPSVVAEHQLPVQRDVPIPHLWKEHNMGKAPPTS